MDELTITQVDSAEAPRPSRWLALASGGWLLLAAAAVVIIAAALPAYADGIIHPDYLARVDAPPGVRLALNSISTGASLLAGVGSLLLAALIYRRRRHNAAALLTATFLVLLGIVMGGPLEMFGRMHGSETLALFVQPLLMPLPLLLLYTFPSGHFVPGWSRRLVPVVFLLTPVMLFVALDMSRVVTTLVGGALLVAFIALVAVGFYGQVVRYRFISGVRERQQTQWVIYGLGLWFALITLTSVPYMMLQNLPPDGPLPAWALLTSTAWWLTQLVVPTTMSIAVLRRRLWRIDRLVNRTLVYGTLTALIVAAYVLVVGVLGVALQASGNFVLSLVATGAIALLFHPLRVRLQRGVNRLLYGERADPYAVLAQLNRRLKEVTTPEAVLPTLVASIGRTLKLPYVAVALGDDAPAAAFGTPPGTDVTQLPLQFRDEPIGRLLLAPRSADEPFTPSELHLLHDVARQVAVAAYVVRLTADLQQSRVRLVTAREEERRRLRRDLHDGLGPALAALVLQADAARELIDVDADEARAVLADLTQEAQSVLGDIRRLVYDLRPPALDELGLAGAIRQHVAKLPRNGPAVTVTAPDPLPPLPAAVEVAAFRIAQEAVSNVVRHADARRCTVQLTVGDGLTLTISDDGNGLAVAGAAASAGVGLISMRERSAELGGTLSLTGAPGQGTTITARLPLVGSGDAGNG